MFKRILFFATAWMVGCAGQQPLIYHKPYDSPEAALNMIQSSTVSGAATATARIEITDRESRYLLRAAVMIKRPGSLRLEMMPVIGTPDLFASIDNGEIRLFIPSKKRFYQGKASALNISRLLHIFVNGDELISMMMGFPPYDEKRLHSLKGKMDDKYYKIDQQREAGDILSFWIDPSVNRVFKMSLTQQNSRSYEAFFEKYTLLEGHSMPQSLTITGDKNARLKITYHDIRNVPDDKALFSLSIPDGIVPTPLD